MRSSQIDWIKNKQGILFWAEWCTRNPTECGREVQGDSMSFGPMWLGEQGIKFVEELWKEVAEYELKNGRDRIKNPSFARHKINKKK